MAGFETIHAYSYRVPRYAHRETISGETIAQTIGDVEIKVWRAEWVKMERINDLVREHFPQDTDDSFIVQGEPEKEQILPGHNLYNVSLIARRFVKNGEMDSAERNWLTRSVQ